MDTTIPNLHGVELGVVIMFLQVCGHDHQSVRVLDVHLLQLFLDLLRLHLLKGLDLSTKVKQLLLGLIGEELVQSDRGWWAVLGKLLLLVDLEGGKLKENLSTCTS